MSIYSPEPEPPSDPEADVRPGVTVEPGSEPDGPLEDETGEAASDGTED